METLKKALDNPGKSSQQGSCFTDCPGILNLPYRKRLYSKHSYSNYVQGLRYSYSDYMPHSFVQGGGFIRYGVNYV